MGAKSNHLLLFYFLNILIIFAANGVKIQLFQHVNFTGLLWESNATDDCNNIPKSEIGYVYSMRTDTCFIAYNFRNCDLPYSMKYMPGENPISSDQLGRDGYIKSFHICNEEEGGNQLNVDITTDVTFIFRDVHVLASYRNVCYCVNVPQYVQELDGWSMNTHHNTMLAYYEQDCSEDNWRSKFFAAERWNDSNEMHRHNKTDSETNTTYKIQSFGPDPNSVYFQTSCKFSDVTTENWELYGSDDLGSYVSATECVKMKSFWNIILGLIFYYWTSFV